MATEYEQGKSPLEYLTEVEEIFNASGFMKDEDLSKAMGMVIKLTTDEAVSNMPAKRATNLVVQLEAWAAMFKLKGRSLMLLPIGEDPAKRKGFYLSISDSLQRLADALKYSTRV